MKEISVTRALKPLLGQKKLIRKITKYYDRESRKDIYRIYLKRGCVSCYDGCELDTTDYDCSGSIDEDAKNIDAWLNEILYTPDGLKEAIEKGHIIEYLD